MVMNANGAVLVVSGSRILRPSEEPFVEERLLALFAERDVRRLFHGAARGVDTFAEGVARAAGVEVRAFLANWSLGRSAGHVRNRRMLHAAQLDGGSLLIAFPRVGGRGTQNCIAAAEKLGFEVLSYSLRDDA